jgi:hypothetical protein
VPLAREHFARSLIPLNPGVISSGAFPLAFRPVLLFKSATLLLLAMFAFNFAFFRRNESFAMRFLLKFQAALAIFFFAAFVLRWFEMFE